MDALWHDVRFGARELLRHPGFAIIAILTLALGIGANTAVFTMVDALLFKPMAAVAPDRLAWIAQRAGNSSHYRSMSYLDYRSYRDQAKELSGVLAYGRVSLALGGANAARVDGQLVSGNYFDLLGIRPVIGRAFLASEDSVPGAAPVAIVGYSLWREKLAADSGVVGRTIVINGHPFTVVGVAPAGFSGVGIGDAASLFIPLAMQAQAMPGERDLLTNRDAGWLGVIGRLKDGVSIERASADVQRIATTLHVDRTEPNQAAALPIRGGLEPSNRQEALPVMSLLMVVPLLVLLVACANVANMLLARGMARRKELAVRRALGGARARIVRQLLTEALLLALAAGVVGVMFAFWLTSLIVRLGNVPVEVAGILVPDVRVLAFTGVVAAITVIVFGLAPALSATSHALTPALKNDGRSVSVGRVRHRLRDAFVVAQLALSLLLLVTAGLFVRSLGKALRVDPGFESKDRVVVAFDLQLQGYTPTAMTRFYRDLMARTSAVPGVQSAALTTVLPLSGRLMGNEVLPAGAAADARSEGTTFAAISPRYFETLGIPVLRGRDFTEDDVAGSPLVAIINVTLARRLFGTDDAVGKQLRFSNRGEPYREIVGVVRDGKYGSLTEDPAGALYLPPLQYPDAGSQVSFIVHAPGSGAALVATMTRVMRDLDPDLPLSSALTLDASLRSAADKQQAAAAMLGVFGALALLLASLGVYGVMAHGVAVRTREIGIRVALGAGRANVLSLFIRDGGRLAAVGVVLGLLLSLAVSRLLSNMLFGLSATDLTTFGAGALVLATVALLASYLPARRAARVDPVIAMRAE